MNKKGFTLVETLIVSTIVSGILVYLFIQLSYLKRSYNVSFKYNTVNDLYALEDLCEYVSSLSDRSFITDTIDSEKYVYINFDNEEDNNIDITNYDDFSSVLDTLDISSLIIAKEDLTELKSINNNVFTQGMNQFIGKINYEKNSHYRLIAYFKDKTYANLVCRWEGSDE